ncbi:hypothetical protein DFR68_12348 [Nocardia mexicana]|uniref:Uncharacterized protein n=1 Tax=Nocardia mexicana TaxID=279262 RepID=A0A370GGJ5_9NOCA|nr:hypothetical protein DFR68_12348 [Nocardia mexicana]
MSKSLHRNSGMLSAGIHVNRRPKECGDPGRKHAGNMGVHTHAGNMGVHTIEPNTEEVRS